jgi:hypothetical protein
MAGTSIRNFLDFMDATGPVYLTGPDVLINEAVKRNYLFGDLIREKNQAIQGGKEIKDVLMLDDSSTFQYYQPNETFSYSNPQVLSEITANWRFAMDHMTFTDAEIELNVGGGLSREATKTVYKDLKRAKEQRMVTSMVNGYEDSLFRPTQGLNFADMESNTGKTPYSIPAFITENCVQTSLDGGGANGLRGGMPICADTAEHGVVGSDNTKILGIAPGTNDRWTNEVVFYDSTAALGINSGLIGGTTASFNKAKVVQDNTTAGTYDADGAALNQFAAINAYGFLNGFDEMYLRLQFRPPASFEQYFENIVFNRQKILCSREGINLYKQALRSENDRTFAPADVAYNQPTYSGIPLTYVAQLDSAAIFPKHATAPANHQITEYDDEDLDPNAGTTELATDVINPGPRYYFINGDYLTPVLHASRYMEKHPTMQHPNQPFTHVQITDSWYNVVANSRQRHGILAPMITA